MDVYNFRLSLVKTKSIGVSGGNVEVDGSAEFIALAAQDRPCLDWQPRLTSCLPHANARSVVHDFGATQC